MLGDTQEDAADGSQSVTEVTENIFSSWIIKKKITSENRGYFF